MYPASSSSPSQKPTGLTRYGSAPSSLLATAVDAVIGAEHELGSVLKSIPSPLGGRHSHSHSHYFSGDSSSSTTEPTCKVNSSAEQHQHNKPLHRSHGLNEIAARIGSSSSSSANSPSSSLLRQRSSPPGFLSHLTTTDNNTTAGGFTLARGARCYGSHGGNNCGHGATRLKSQLSFTRQDSLSQISEVSENIIDGVSSENGQHNATHSFATGFGMDSWDNTNSIVFSAPPSKRTKTMDGDIYSCLNVLESQFSLPQTTLEMAAVEKLLHIPEDSVPCKIRAKRGFATHPRSIAERERRTRISGKLKKLQELVPNMDKEQDTKRMIGRASERDGLYYLKDQSGRIRVENPLSTSFLSESVMSNKDKIWLYHRRLGHPSFNVLKLMFPKLFKESIVESFHCNDCELAKHKRTSFPISNTKTLIPFSLIHSDIWGPSTIPNISGAKWFVSFIDDCTRVTWLYLLKNKSDVGNVFPNFYNMVKTQFDVRIKRFRSDNAKDYFNQILSPFFQKEGIIHESSCVCTPQQNGVAERKNGHLLDSTRALLFHKNVPKKYWGEAVLTAAHLINRLPTRVLAFKSPIETLIKFFPNFQASNNLIPRIFGSVAFVHVHSQNRGKLDPRALRCIFVGYSSTQKGYKCFHPPTRKFFVSADVTFVENESFFKNSYLQGETLNEDRAKDRSLDFSSQPDLLESPVEPVSAPLVEFVSTPVETTSVIVESPKSKEVVIDKGKQDNIRPLQVYSRKKIPISRSVQVQSPLRTTAHIPETAVHVPEMTSRHTEDITPTAELIKPTDDHEKPSEVDLPIALRKGTRTCTKHPLYLFMSYQNISQSHRAFLSNLHTIHIPRNLSEALGDKKWEDAMKTEMEALEKNKTWELVKLPRGKKLVGCRWIFTMKYKSDGLVERYKARLVAKGYTQTYGIDYLETFAPVAKMNTVRVLLSLAANFGWNLQQFDVKNASLHGDLEEEIYMEVPPGFESKEGMVCRLKKALYGLKQSPRAWFGRFAKVMTTLGYKQSQGDHTLFVRHSNLGGVTALLVYVDDIIVTGNDAGEMNNLRQCLLNEFDIKELGRLKYFLGIEVAHSKQGIFISQQKYVLDLLKETGKLGCRPVDTPVEFNLGLCDAPMVDKGSYQRLVGRLIYLAHTRPDIAFAVSVVSQFMHNPKETHLKAVHRILQYLKGNPGRGILFKKGESITLEAYTDADYAGSLVDRRSTSGYCTLLGGNLVTWRSKKQNVVARSSAESEFRSMAMGICELLWLKLVLDDLKIKWEGPMRLYCDNKSAISIAHNPVQHDRTKHIEVDRHFIKEKLDSGLICTLFVSTKDQLADVLTKGLPSTVFRQIVSKLGMEDIHSPA